MTIRRYVTRVVARKTKWVVIRHGRVQFSHKDLDAVEAFLRGFDPELAERRARAKSGRSEAFLQELLREEEQSTGPDLVCWEHQANREPIRLSFSIKVF